LAIPLPLGEHDPGQARRFVCLGDPSPVFPPPSQHALEPAAPRVLLALYGPYHHSTEYLKKIAYIRDTIRSAQYTTTVRRDNSYIHFQVGVSKQGREFISPFDNDYPSGVQIIDEAKIVHF
jgi:hypothetical protein